MMRDLETESVWGSSLDSLAAEDVSAGGLTVTESRGRRVSSLGDEVYYALDTDGGVGGVASKLTSMNMKHQHLQNNPQSSLTIAKLSVSPDSKDNMRKELKQGSKLSVTQGPGGLAYVRGREGAVSAVAGAV